MKSKKQQAADIAVRLADGMRCTLDTIVPPHMKGDAKNGTVAKDYLVKPALAASAAPPAS